ncbi:MAG: Thioredoxin reductase [candidate division TM6 bacterium GW2011_GWE2_41_16]|nr:MAG: Thioredoxin reductase [candidate division TM6 bacterium GW2011_GWE2_41_16]
MNISLKVLINIALVGVVMVCDAKSHKRKVLVIGAGPAGCAAAMVIARGGFEVDVLRGNNPGGQLMGAGVVENVLGVTPKRGYQIIADMAEQAEKFGVHFIDDTAFNIDDSARPFKVTCDSGDVLQPDAVILATGGSPRMLGIPGENEYWGKGVSSCAVCDCFMVKGKHAIIIGGGDSAVDHILHLVDYADTITLCVRSERMRAAPHSQKKLQSYLTCKSGEEPKLRILYNTDIVSVRGDGERLAHVQLRDKTTGVVSEAAAAGLFLAIGHIPQSDVCPVSVQKNDDGTIYLPSRTQATTCPGFFAAGDVADSVYRQVDIAKGDGTKAGHDAIRYLWSLQD